MRVFHLGLILLFSTALTSCSENAATGQKQFTALLPASQEASVGASEHEKAIAQYGVYGDARVRNYVSALGQRLAANAERKDVNYTFTVLDSPVINAFALPGGYVYVTRGLMAWANNEAELAAVMAHEIGHVVARHSAARYSQAALAQVGLQVLSIAVKTPGVADAANLGTNLYLSQYSQSQEYEADTLGIRYNAKTGYDPLAMSGFLNQLARNDAYESTYKNRKSGDPINQFFASHPSTPARVKRAASEAGQYTGAPANQNSVAYLQLIDGIVYGDGDTDGYVRGNSFVHPKLGFSFDVPNGFAIQNSKKSVIAKHPDGVTMIFDMAKKSSSQPIKDYLFNTWGGAKTTELQDITINGLPAATATAAQGSLNGQAVSVRLVAIQASPTEVYRFQYAIPQDIAGNSRLQSDIQASARSFRMLSESERRNQAGQRIAVVAAKAGDTAQSLADTMSLTNPQERLALFYALNGLDNGAPLTTGRLYKLVR